MLKKILLSFLFLLLTTNLYSKNNFFIEGYVKNSEGKPLSKAEVYIKNSKNGVLTDQNGKFIIDNLKAGNYNVIFSYLGYNKIEKQIDLTQEKQVLDIVLEKNILELETVTVSAEKKEERIQNVPLSVAAISETKINSLQISSSHELGKITPNFLSYDDGVGLFTLFSSRGIVSVSEKPTVGYYIDDVPLFTTYSFPTFLNNIERIEVLKGPQGTIYGRNSIGGVINIITKKPTNETRINGSLGYGNFNQLEIQTNASLPLVKDKLFLRVGGAHTKRDGYIKNSFNDIDDVLLSRKINSGILKLSYIPNKKIFVSLSSNAEQRTVRGFALVGGFGVTGKKLDSLLKNHPYETNINREGERKVILSNTSLKFNYLFNNIKLSSVTSFQLTVNETSQPEDFDYSPQDVRYTLGKSINRTFSEEIRVSSNHEDKKINWNGGIYFYFVNNDINSILVSGKDNILVNPMLSDSDKLQFPFSQLKDTDYKQNGFSVFGEASYNIIDDIKITAGGRYEIETNEVNVDEKYAKDGKDFIYASQAIQAKPQTFDKKTDFNFFSPKINIAYNIKENNLVYANYTRGYRPGGVNEFSPSEDKTTFTPEYSQNFEIGSKNTLMDNRIKLNLVAFYSQYKDQQLYSAASAQNMTLVVGNIGNSEAYGIELESEFLLFEGFIVNGNLGWQKTEFTNYKYSIPGMNPVTRAPLVINIDNNGNEQVSSPQFNGSTGITYGFDINKNWKASFSTDYRFQSSMYLDPENNVDIDPYSILDGSFTVGNKNIELTIWSKNIADIKYFSYSYALPGGMGNFANYGLPRTFGAKLNFRIKDNN